MAKKGKEKVSASSTAKRTTTASAPEDDIIFFTNEKPKAKKKDPNAAAAGNAAGASADDAGPPKPTVKQIIGGQSWTGKLPVNLLSEHCQRQKWNRPDYSQRQLPEGWSSMVSLSTKDPKTQEVIKLPPFKLPPSLLNIAVKATALEARHFAATYGLFRVASGQNMSMILPPDYRSVWKEFEALKKQDVKDGRGYMYDANPFAVVKAQEEAKVAAEKKRKEIQAAKEKAASLPGAAGLVLRSNAGGTSGGHGGRDPMRGWSTVPKVEIGNKTRAHLESLLRRESIWNPHGVDMSAQQRTNITSELSKLGFRPSHIEEACEACKDREEALEWLLIHVPEDDLPSWALPERYSAGLTVGATDLKREGAIKRLAEPGYSIDLCRKVYDESNAEESTAAEVLQKILLGSSLKTDTTGTMADMPEFERQSMWDEEIGSLESVYGPTYTRVSPEACRVKLDSVTDGVKNDVEAVVQIRRAATYPSGLVVEVVAKLPSYIRLSVMRKSLEYMGESLEGEETKMFFVVSWIQENINDIIKNPGPLRDIAAVSSTASEAKAPILHKRKRTARHPRAVDWLPDSRSIQQWLDRQKTPGLQKMVLQRQNLPAWGVRGDIIRIVKDHQVTIISGETGSGKSTQSVQFILDDLYERGYGKCVNMIVTQPRRISALGLADRVSEERCSTVGQEVGYTIRGENKTSKDTKITFVTTGVLLRRLQTSGGKTDDIVAALADVSHVVIDEVHERSLDTDFLLSIIRDVLKKRSSLKLILMSATLDSATFARYFEQDGIKVGSVEIAGRTFPVQDYYLDDIIHMTGFTMPTYHSRDDDRPQARTDHNADPVSKVIQSLGMRINYNLLVDTATALDRELSQTQKSGGILIFLPGVAEISRACNMLSAAGSSLHVLPLHASLETRQQRQVFAPPPHGKRKVVVATNVAETSITIDDIVAVIDSGRVKETSFDPQNNMRKLEETWASRAACKQRRGRAGRVQAGKCYKLYTRNREDEMAERPEPEIRRVPLEQLCLSVRAMGNHDVAGFLARTPTPPEATAVVGAIRMLRRMGALDGDELTALGEALALIPADLRCGKLMIYGAIFGCLDECIIIAAILSTRSPFLSPAEKRDEAKRARMTFARGDGDLLTDCRAYQQWDEMSKDRVPQRQIRQFCEENFLSFNTLSDIASTKSQYYSSLKEAGIISFEDSSAAQGAPIQSSQLLRALTASAFSPQIARIQFPDKKFAASVSGAVALDPEAKTIKYFSQENGRVFVHPSSTLFDSPGFTGNAAFISYFTMMATSKVFIRDLTPFNACTLLLFSGAIELDTLGRGLVVDGWLKLRGWARIGVLVSRLRAMVDDVIAKKVADPRLDLRDNEVIKAVVRLIEYDGLDA